MTHDIYHDLEVIAPIETVFDAITLPEHLIQWWPLKCTGEPQKDAVYNFFFTSVYDWYGKVIRITPNKSFFIKMTSADEDWNPTTFGFDLEQKKDTVLIKFSHTGWPTCNAHFRRSSFCWALLLNGLKNYVESGIVIPFTERG